MLLEFEVHSTNTRPRNGVYIGENWAVPELIHKFLAMALAYVVVVVAVEVAVVVVQVSFGLKNN